MAGLCPIQVAASMRHRRLYCDAPLIVALLDSKGQCNDISSSHLPDAIGTLVSEPRRLHFTFASSIPNTDRCNHSSYDAHA